MWESALAVAKLRRVRTLSLRLLLLVVKYLPPAPRAAAVRRLAAARYRRYYHGTRPQAANMTARLAVPPPEAEQLLLRSFELDLWNVLDGARLGSLTPANVPALIDLHGLEHLDAALAGGRGAVLSGGHVAGMDVFFAVLGVLGYPTNMIRLDVSGTKGRLARWAHRRHIARLERQGSKTLWMAPGSFAVAVHALNALRRGELIVSPIDLAQSSDNATVEFLGASAPFPRGLAKIARAAEAPLLDFFVHRGADNRLVGEIGEPYVVTDIDAAVQHSAARLAEHIRAHPADWGPWHVFTEWSKLGDPNDLRLSA